MKLKPLFDKVIVKPIKAEEVTKSGIILPESSKNSNLLRGTVISVGNGTKNEEMIVKENDTVIYGRFGGTEIEVEGEKLLLMKQSDILAIID